jgi:starch synthase
MKTIKVGMVTKEWPPYVYGGAGVHVVQLAEALRAKSDIELSIHCFGPERTDAHAYSTPIGFSDSNPALQAIATDLAITNDLSSIDVVHTHTWYANMAGHASSLLYGIPHVMSAHSLEPLRPWKADQLGGGYQLSSWVEKTAVENAAAIIAVSDAMRSDLLSAYPDVKPEKVHTIRNGVDTNKFAPNFDPSVLTKYGIDGRFALFVGRITRQKGLKHLLRAWKSVPAEYGLVLAAGSPDEPGIGKEIAKLISDLQSTRRNVWWIQEMLPHHELTALLTASDLFLCPSVYEPLGIVNLEAMGCATAVLASKVGGIPEVVADGITGELVPYLENSEKFEAHFSSSITRLMGTPHLLKEYGEAGRLRAKKEFSWDAVAEKTRALYLSLIK